MNIKKVSLFAVIALAIYLVVNDPEGSAGGVRAVLLWLQNAAGSLITFLRNLFS